MGKWSLILINVQNRGHSSANRGDNEGEGREGGGLGGDGNEFGAAEAADGVPEEEDWHRHDPSAPGFFMSPWGGSGHTDPAAWGVAGTPPPNHPPSLPDNFLLSKRGPCGTPPWRSRRRRAAGGRWHNCNDWEMISIVLI